MVTQVRSFSNGQDFIIKNGYAWQIFAYRSSKRAAQETTKSLVAWTKGKGVKFTTVKTNKGWGVFQLVPDEKFRIRASSVGKYM